MIEGLINLVSYGSFGSGTIGNILAQWQAAGIFDYALPFLLIFALVFAILSFIPIFKGNKGINAVISLATALMALQFGIVSIFFSEIFPRLGIALSIVLVIIILLGLFVDDKDVQGNKIIKWILVIVIIIIAIVVISTSLNSFGFGFGGGQFWYFVRANAAAVIGIVLVVAAVIAIIASGSKKPELPEIKVPYFNQGK